MDRFTKVLFIFILACGALSWASVAISVVKFLIIPIFGVITLYKIYKAIKFFFPYKNNTVPVNGLVDYKKIENKNEENDRSINDRYTIQSTKRTPNKRRKRKVD